MNTGGTDADAVCCSRRSATLVLLDAEVVGRDHALARDLAFAVTVTLGVRGPPGSTPATVSSTATSSTRTT
jgi:hypothetical protein